MMNRRALALAIFGVVGSTLHSSAGAESAAAVKKTIQAAYAKRDAAAQKKDIKGSLATVAPDFVFVAKDGQKGDVKLLKRRLTPLFAVMQQVKSKSEIQKFALKGKEVTATVKQHLEMVVVNPQTQMPQKFVADATSEDLWTKSSGTWLQKRMTTKTEKALLDNKSIDDKFDLEGKPSTHGAPAKNKSSR